MGAYCTVINLADWLQSRQEHIQRTRKQGYASACGRLSVNDPSARMERFFSANPLIAEDYLDHPACELRVAAARYADLSLLKALLDDPAPEVRAVIAQRLPESEIRTLSTDADPRVRIVVANRFGGPDLIDMLGDEDRYVRLAVVRRLPPDVLVLGVRDYDPEIRRCVAGRIEPALLFNLVDDHDPCVRLEVAERLPASHLPILARDSDLQVRVTVAERIAESELAQFLDDPEEIIREIAYSRLVARSERHVNDIMGTAVQPVSAGVFQNKGTVFMKVMIRQSPEIGLSIYVPKKDLEEPIVEKEHETLWGGWIRIANGWVLDLPEMAADTRLPITVNARKRSEEG